MNKSKYSSLVEWRKHNQKAYLAALRNGWLFEICEQFGWEIPEQKILTRWTKEKCINDALLYETNTEWTKKSPTAYMVALKNGWLDECRQHMPKLKHRDGFYQIKENCINAAKSCKLRWDFRTKYSAAYRSAIKNNWINECEIYFKKANVRHNYWTFEKCQDVAMKCKNRTEFSIKYQKEYTAARKNSWLDKLCSHMKVIKEKWTEIKCLEVAKKYKTLKEWRTNHQSSYVSARYNGWLENCSKHLIQRKSRNYYTKDMCKNLAKLYTSRSTFQKNEPGACSKARKNNWFEECCRHMKKK